MPFKEAKKSDSVSMKAMLLLEEGRVVYPKKLKLKTKELVVEVYGEHSGSLINPDKEVPYVVVIRKNGEHTCSCENATFSNANEYRQFWGDVPIRAKPECSHVLAAKLHPTYFWWYSDGKRKKENIEIKSKVKTGRIKLPPTHSTKPTLSRRRRNVNFSDLIRRRNDLI